MKKIMLVLIVLVIGLFNYKLLILDEGIHVVTFKKVNVENHSTLEQLEFLLSIKEVYYYDHPFSNDYIGVLYTESNGIQLKSYDSNDIDTFKQTSILISNLKPHHIKPVPLYIYGLGIIIIAFLPKKKK